VYRWIDRSVKKQTGGSSSSEYSPVEHSPSTWNIDSTQQVTTHLHSTQLCEK